MLTCRRTVELKLNKSKALVCWSHGPARRDRAFVAPVLVAWLGWSLSGMTISSSITDFIIVFRYTTLAICLQSLFIIA